VAVSFIPVCHVEAGVTPKMHVTASTAETAETAEKKKRRGEFPLMTTLRQNVWAGFGFSGFRD
jgi:hypothetical protein